MRARRQRPVTLLVRRMNRTWGQWGTYDSDAEAEDAWGREISKRGITAWSWWGPTAIAKRMLADPSYEHKPRAKRRRRK